MIRAINTAATGMAAQEANVNTISNNIANANTNGYKQARTEFEDLLYETVQEAGGRSSGDSKYNVGIQLGSGSKVSGTRKSFKQGSPIITNNTYDLMIQGEGFFGIVMPNGQVNYTRDGSFNVDAAGNMVNKNGFKLFPGIVLPPGTKSINIAQDGKVEAYVGEDIEPKGIGSIPVFNFVNPVGLKNAGGNNYRQTPASGAPTQYVAGDQNSGTIVQGALESSNVNVMNEMTNLIKAQRAYEMNSKVMKVADQMLQNTNNIR